jgi:hypothetical protein
MTYSKLQLRVLQVYKQFLRALNANDNQQESIKTLRQIFKANAYSIEKSNLISVESQLRLAERRLAQLKNGSIQQVSTIRIRKNE